MRRVCAILLLVNIYAHIRLSRCPHCGGALRLGGGECGMLAGKERQVSGI